MVPFLQSSNGIVPRKRLYRNDSDAKAGNPNKLTGKYPSILLNPKSTATNPLLYPLLGFQISTPDKLLLERLICCNPGSWKNHDCKTPVNELALSSTVSSRVNPMKEVFTMGPDNEFALIAISSKFGGSLGRLPENLLKLRSSLVK